MMCTHHLPSLAVCAFAQQVGDDLNRSHLVASAAMATNWLEEPKNITGEADDQINSTLRRTTEATRMLPAMTRHATADVITQNEEDTKAATDWVAQKSSSETAMAGSESTCASDTTDGSIATSSSMAPSSLKTSTIPHHAIFNGATPKKEATSKKEPLEMSRGAGETAASGPITRYEDGSIVPTVDAAHASIVRERAFFTAAPRPNPTTVQAPPLLTTSSIVTGASEVRIDPDPPEESLVHWACNCPSARAEGLPLEYESIWPAVVALGDPDGVNFAFPFCWLMPLPHLPTVLAQSLPPSPPSTAFPPAQPGWQVSLKAAGAAAMGNVGVTIADARLRMNDNDSVRALAPTARKRFRLPQPTSFAVALCSLPYGMVEALPPNHRSDASRANRQPGADASLPSTPVVSDPVEHEDDAILQVCVAHT